MTQEEKAAVRIDRLTMPAVDVARKYGITRQRVYQIMQEPPGAGISVQRPPRTLEALGFVRFAHAKTRHLNELAVQLAIRKAVLETGATYCEVAKMHGCTYHAVQRIVQMTVPERHNGRPRKSKSTPEILLFLAEKRRRLNQESATRKLRNDAIMQDRQTMTLEAIAKKYGLSFQMVCRIQRLMPQNLTRFDGRVR